MSKYTLELRELFEPIKFNPPIFTREEVENFFSDYELSDYLTDDQINTINTFGVWKKEKLASMIVDHYYMKEIGSETIGQFKLRAKVEMQEIMEEYLPIIYSSSIYYEPLVNVDYTETFTRSANVSNAGESNSLSTSTGTSTSLSSDTPQGRITKQDILNGTYASSSIGSESDTSVGNETTTSSGSDSTEEYTKRIKGNSGVSATAQKMIEQYRNNIRAINKEIIEKLNDLFMGIW